MIRIRLAYTLLVSIVLGACAAGPAQQPVAPVAAPVSQSQRPEWTMKEPDREGQDMVFIGISNPYATERLARDDAIRNATQRVVEYLGTAAQSKFEQASTSFGLSSAVVDPTQATRAFQQQLSGNVARRLKPAQWYMEREQMSTGTGYVVFVKSVIPVSEINAAFQQTAADNMKAAQDRARQASDDQAKRQADQAAQFWDQMSKQGLVPDKQ
jgi:hypothetical protein